MKNLKASEACKNCGTLRDCYPIYCKGYCKDCYLLLQRKKQIEAWDWDNPATLKGYPKAYPWPRGVPSKIPEDSWMHPRNELRKFKECQLEKINDRLRSLWSRESRLSGPIDGMDIELMLRHLAERAGARDRNILYGITNLVVANFSPKQRKILFEWLNEIEESPPWGPRRRWRHFPPLQIGEAPKIEKITSDATKLSLAAPRKIQTLCNEPRSTNSKT
jgi:hypothetical protein